MFYRLAIQGFGAVVSWRSGLPRSSYWYPNCQPGSEPSAATNKETGVGPQVSLERQGLALPKTMILQS